MSTHARRETPKTKSNLKLSTWQCLKKCASIDAPWRNAIASGTCRKRPKRARIKNGAWSALFAKPRVPPPSPNDWPPLEMMSRCRRSRCRRPLQLCRLSRMRLHLLHRRRANESRFLARFRLPNRCRLKCQASASSHDPTTKQRHHSSRRHSSRLWKHPKVSRLNQEWQPKFQLGLPLRKSSGAALREAWGRSKRRLQPRTAERDWCSRRRFSRLLPRLCAKPSLPRGPARVFFHPMRATPSTPSTR